jgi:hypothetical protein
MILDGVVGWLSLGACRTDRRTPASTFSAAYRNETALRRPPSLGQRQATMCGSASPAPRLSLQNEHLSG